MNDYEGRVVDMEDAVEVEDVDRDDQQETGERPAELTEAYDEIDRLKDQLEQVELLYLAARAEALQRKRAMDGRPT